MPGRPEGTWCSTEPSERPPKSSKAMPISSYIHCRSVSLSTANMKLLTQFGFWLSGQRCHAKKEKVKKLHFCRHWPG